MWEAFHYILHIMVDLQTTNYLGIPNAEPIVAETIEYSDCRSIGPDAQLREECPLLGFNPLLLFVVYSITQTRVSKAWGYAFSSVMWEHGYKDFPNTKAKFDAKSDEITNLFPSNLITCFVAYFNLFLFVCIYISVCLYI